ncbi:MFS transporter [Micromonospora sagamiensis]|uniref:MFS transporter n=1 Tax=Micromonospora sagamiensis TaxID=47875 RepID=A0A562WE19_9ACTN|nr:MFS transporter [Micromonospora sagamiensis]TWJ28540.1 MFS transporter [Micromonospora sagamiensis]
MPATVTRPHRFLVPLVCLAPLLANADAGLVVLALPDIQRDLSMSLIGAHWVTNVYVVLVGGLQLLGGRLCDRFGARRLLLSSLMAFAVTSALCAVAPTGWVLLAARAGQAVAAAVLVPAAMCVLLTMAPGEAQRRSGLALWAASGGIGSVAGVLTGGLAATQLSWRWAFLLNVPLALGAFMASRRLEPGDKPCPRGAAVGVPGALLLVGTLLTLVYAMVSVADQGFGPSTCALLAVAVVLGGSFLRCEARSAHPLIPVVLLRNRSLATGALGILFVAAATGPVVFVSSVYLREAHGYSAWTAGCALLPVVGGVIVVGRWSSHLLGRYGPRLPCLVACGLTGSGLVWLASLSPDSEYSTRLLPGLVLVGAGLPVLWMSCELAAVSTVGRTVVGAAAGVVQCAGQIGAALGLAVAVTVYSGTGHSADGPANPGVLTEGATRAFWCCAALMLCVALTAQLGLGPRRSRPVSDPTTGGFTLP